MQDARAKVKAAEEAGAASAAQAQQKQAVRQLLIAPRTFSDFEILSLLGCGDFGMVLKCRVRRPRPLAH